MLDIQEALLNFGAVWHALWPFDPTPQILQRVLLHFDYAAGEGDERKRVSIINEFVNNVLYENSTRAGLEDPPLTFRQQKERFREVLESRGGARDRDRRREAGGRFRDKEASNRRENG